MLTVKVMKDGTAITDQDVATRGSSGRFSTKIVEAEEVDVHVLRPGELIEVAARCGDRTYAFYVADRHKPRPDGFTDEVDFCFSAFIENSAGATTEVVRF
jgi:hypothetical protein